MTGLFQHGIEAPLLGTAEAHLAADPLIGGSSSGDGAAAE